MGRLKYNDIMIGDICNNLSIRDHEVLKEVVGESYNYEYKHLSLDTLFKIILERRRKGIDNNLYTIEEINKVIFGLLSYFDQGVEVFVRTNVEYQFISNDPIFRHVFNVRFKDKAHFTLKHIDTNLGICHMTYNGFNQFATVFNLSDVNSIEDFRVVGYSNSVLFGNWGDSESKEMKDDFFYPSSEVLNSLPVDQLMGELIEIKEDESDSINF